MLPYSCQYLDESDYHSVLSALKRDNITQGELVDVFEDCIAKYVGAKYVVVFNSATSALNIAYKILDVKGAEFITTPITFCATANMMLENNIKPVFCDVDLTGNIDSNLIENHITSNTKAIVSVDYAGNSVNIDKIVDICKDNSLFFVSDSSHSFGGEFMNKKIGSFADMTIFSFHALKPITTIEGGAIVTNNRHFYEQAVLLRSHGIKKNRLWDSELDVVGYNFRLSDVACALGISQIKKIDSFILKRKKIASFYDLVFKNSPYFSIIEIPSHIKSTYHLYPILLDDRLIAHKESIFTLLHDLGIGVQVHYKPLYKFNLYNHHTPLATSERFYSSEITIPCHQRMLVRDAEYVADNLINACKKFWF